MVAAHRQGIHDHGEAGKSHRPSPGQGEKQPLSSPSEKELSFFSGITRANSVCGVRAQAPPTERTPHVDLLVTGDNIR